MPMESFEWWYIQKFGKLAEHAREIIQIMQRPDQPSSSKAREAKKIEHDKADAVVMEIVHALRSAGKPVLRSSESKILEAAHSADGPADEAEKAANRIAIYHVELDETSSKLLEFLDKALESVIAATAALGKKRRKDTDYLAASRHCENIKRMESEADLVYRAGLEKIAQEQDDILKAPGYFGLNKEEIRAIVVASRRKEILEILEHALDKCQSLADKLEGINHDLQ